MWTASHGGPLSGDGDLSPNRGYSVNRSAHRESNPTAVHTKDGLHHERAQGAGRENRTPASCLEGTHAAITPPPHVADAGYPVPPESPLGVANTEGISLEPLRGFEPRWKHYESLPIPERATWSRLRESNPLALASGLQPATRPSGLTGVVPELGFEPSQRGSKPRVLPLDDSGSEDQDQNDNQQDQSCKADVHIVPLPHLDLRIRDRDSNPAYDVQSVVSYH